MMPPAKNIVKVKKNISTRRGLNSRRDSAKAVGMVTTMFSAVPSTVYTMVFQ